MLHRTGTGKADIQVSGILIPFMNPTKTLTRLVDFAMHRVRMLIHFGVTPYLVFDGDHLPSKSETEKGRAERRKECRRAGLELLQLGKVTQAHQELQKAVDITPELAKQLILELRRNKIEYVVAPYEADSQLCYLERKGIIHGILSEDSDLLVFGAKCLLTKLDQYGECIMIRQQDFTACREVNLIGWTCADFRRMAILSGCDYLVGIHKMGLKTAHRLVRKYKTLDRIIRCAQLEGKFHIPTGYLESFTQAEMTFLYQWVYCPESRRLVNLTSPESEEQLSGITYIGHYVEPKIARGVAVGDLNPMTKLPIIVDSVSNNSRRTPQLTKSVSVDSAKGKPIDSFFKSKRTPLAEIDPNEFTPSPSQQRLLQQNAGRSWSVNRTDSRPSSAPLRIYRAAGDSATVSRISSAPHPHKRPRLCDDTVELASEPSRFFTPRAPDPSPLLPKAGRTMKKSKLQDVNIWSDDSLDDAMAALPDLSWSSGSIADISILSAVSGNTSHLSNQSANSCNNAEIPTLDVSEELSGKPTTEALCPPSPEPVVDGQDDSEEGETVFSASLLAQTRALRETFRYRGGGLATTSTPTTLSMPAEKPQAVPITPPPQSQHPYEPQPAHLSSSPSSKPVGEAIPESVPDTPPHPGPITSETVPPTTISKFFGAGRKLSSPARNSFGVETDARPPPYTAKGSEDLLVIPDSDADSDCEDDRSSPSEWLVREGGEEEECESVTRLDLGVFVFGAVASAT